MNDPRATASRRDRVAGCLLGGAIGDALGAGVEFHSWADIQRRHGPGGLVDYTPTYGRRGAFTDDTQMTLFTAEGLVLAAAVVHQHDAPTVIHAVHAAYLRWLVTQRDPGSTTADSSGWLINEPGMHAERAPGRTCLGALSSGRVGTTDSSINDSKGCGGVMRVAPVGFVARGAEAFQLGADLAAITHGHPSGYLSSGAFAMVIAEVAHDMPLIDAISLARDELARHPRHEETLAAIDAAIALARRGTPTPHELESLGGGWVGEQALAISLCCALVGTDVRDALVLAVNHGGDSDSTGSITGNLMGAMHGVDALPPDLLAELELRDLIELTATKLADAFS